MLKIFKYSFYDVLRSRWTIIYFLFFFISTLSLLYLSNNLSKAITSLMNIILTIIPLISMIFGVMHYYNSRDFIDLLLSQPVKRKEVFIGQYLGLSISLAAGFLLGILIPFLFYGLSVSVDVWNFAVLAAAGVFLTFIFVALSFFISLLNDDKIKGFGIAILTWLYLAVLYDGMILLVFVSFNEYPLETPALIFTLLNPIDLSRVMVLLQLDISALMGYTGAVFNKFFGTTGGMVLSMASMLIWIILLLIGINKVSSKKDF
ncbi:MAG: ABC transporter permease subunit [Bacteroidetes bacterium]|nr:ABC transporter permease subunit [Bacteroidota bacterium]